MNIHLHTVNRKPPENVIHRFMRDNGITNVWLAEKFGVTPQAIGERLAKSDMETSFVRSCSEFLKHNFFEDLAKSVNLPREKPKPTLYVNQAEEIKMKDYIGTLVEEKMEEYLNNLNMARGASRKKKTG